MTIKEFLEKCAAHGWHVQPHAESGEEGFAVCAPWDDEHEATFASQAQIENGEWPGLYKGIVRGRNVFNVTRIVGYYSRTSNWNKSKLGELKDRRKGRYSVDAIQGQITET